MLRWRSSELYGFLSDVMRRFRSHEVWRGGLVFPWRWPWKWKVTRRVIGSFLEDENMICWWWRSYRSVCSLNLFDENKWRIDWVMKEKSLQKLKTWNFMKNDNFDIRLWPWPLTYGWYILYAPSKVKIKKFSFNFMKIGEELTELWRKMSLRRLKTWNFKKNYIFYLMLWPWPLTYGLDI